MGFLSDVIRHPKKVLKKSFGIVDPASKWLYDEYKEMTEVPSASDAGSDPLPIPDAPIGSGTPGEGSLYQKRKIVKSGRGGTILTGALVPKNIGKRILG